MRTTADGFVWVWGLGFQVSGCVALGSYGARTKPAGCHVFRLVCDMQQQLKEDKVRTTPDGFVWFFQVVWF